MDPILYSFRRCPYAMRARLAIQSAGVQVELREIVLRDKAPEFLATSPKGTVPVLVAEELIEESYDIMLWALGRSDSEGLLTKMTPDAYALIEEADGPFKRALDRTKYAVRYPELDATESRASAGAFIAKLDAQLDGTPWLFGDAPSLADLAILPFVRQFAHVDLDWFSAQPWPHAIAWLEAFKATDRMARVMPKFAPWQNGQDKILFGKEN